MKKLFFAILAVLLLGLPVSVLAETNEANETTEVQQPPRRHAPRHYQQRRYPPRHRRPAPPRYRRHAPPPPHYRRHMPPRHRANRAPQRRSYYGRPRVRY